MKFEKLSKSQYEIALESQLIVAVGWPGMINDKGIAFIKYFNGRDWIYAKSRYPISTDYFFSLKPADVFGQDVKGGFYV